MKKWQEIVTEAYINLINDDPKKSEYVDVVWDMIQNSYKSIGGIHGSGFKSKQDMIDNIPFWKIVKKAGVPVAVFLYKDKSGRKRIATGTNPSLSKDDRTAVLKDFYKAEFARAYSEVSGPSWASIRKNIPEEELLALVKTPNEVKSILPKDEIIPLKDLDLSIDPDFRYEKNSPYNDYYYGRDIGGKIHIKIMLGTTDQFIK